MAKAISTSSGQKCIGETVIRSLRCAKCLIDCERIEQPGGLPELKVCPKCGGTEREIIVAFSSLDAETTWGQRYESARIKYAVLHKRDKIKPFLRDGKRPFLGRMIWTKILERRLKKEVQANG